MQQSLKRYARPSGGKGRPAEQQQQPEQHAGGRAKRKTGSSLLLNALSSQLVRSGGSDNTQSAGASCNPATAGPAVGASSTAPTSAQLLREMPLNLHNMAQPVQQLAPLQQRQQAAGSGLPTLQRQEQQAPSSGSSGSTARLQACPLCGLLLPLGPQLQRHVEEELLLLEQQEEQGDAGQEAQQQQAQPPRQQLQQQQWQGGQQQPQPPWQPEWRGVQQQAQPPRQQQQQGHHQQQQRRHAPAVLVLGGAPALTAPTDRRSLQQLQRLLPHKRPRRAPSAAEYNHYNDGSGAWAGEDIGLELEGASAGLKWEGQGTSEF